MNYLLSVLIVLFGFTAWAQDFELMKISSTYYPRQEVKESAPDAAIGFWEWNGHLAIPQLKKRQKMLLIHKFGYTNLRVDTEGTFSNTSYEAFKHYHAIYYELGLVKILNPTWRLLVNVSPTLASDFSESINRDDYLFQGSAMLMKAKSRQLKYGFGLAYTTRFGRRVVIPTGMLKYRSPKIVLDALLPSKLSLMFQAHPKIQLGLAAKLDGGIFNNSSEIQVVNTLIDEAGYSRLNVGPAAVFKLKMPLISMCQEAWLEAGGLSLLIQGRKSLTEPQKVVLFSRWHFPLTQKEEWRMHCSKIENNWIQAPLAPLEPLLTKNSFSDLL